MFVKGNATFRENVIHKDVSLRKKHLLFVKGRGMMQIRYRWRLTVMNVIFNAAQFCYYYYYFFTHKK